MGVTFLFYTFPLILSVICELSFFNALFWGIGLKKCVDIFCSWLFILSAVLSFLC